MVGCLPCVHLFQYDIYIGYKALLEDILVLLSPSPHHCLHLVQAPPPSKGYHGSKSSIFSIRKQKEEEMQINRVKVQKTLNRLMPYPKSTKIHNMEYEFHIDQIFLDVPFYLLSYSCLII